MEKEELVKMSQKGQLVVPQYIRTQAQLKPGERFIAMPLKGGVAFKKIAMPSTRKAFESLSLEIGRQFKKGKIKRNDVIEAVAWARKE